MRLPFKSGFVIGIVFIVLAVGLYFSVMPVASRVQEVENADSERNSSRAPTMLSIHSTDKPLWELVPILSALQAEYGDEETERFVGVVSQKTLERAVREKLPQDRQNPNLT